MEAKLNLASTIVARYHSPSAAADARAEFRQKFSEREFPVESAERTVLSAEPMALVAVITKARSEEHTSELQSRLHLVCRLLLEKKKKNAQTDVPTAVQHSINEYT